jgi:hypothetical protein
VTALARRGLQSVGPNLVAFPTKETMPLPSIKLNATEFARRGRVAGGARLAAFRGRPCRKVAGGELQTFPLFSNHA